MTERLHVINWEGKRYDIPFDIKIIYPEDKIVNNRFTGEETELPWFAVAIYDLIIGAERFEDYDTMQKGLSWFQKYFPRQYMTLLD
jgi:hypothetical protein